MGWEILVAVGALVLSTITVLARMFDRSLSIREHDEFKRGVERNMDGLQREMQRELDRIENRIQHIEQTRPTTSELSGRLDGLREQITEANRSADKVSERLIK